MKHIGWCLEQIQIVMAKIPRSLETDESKVKASKILNEVEKYLVTLSQLILQPEFKKMLQVLKNANNAEIQLQGHEIEELQKDLEHMLYVVETYIKNLRQIISHHPEQWSSKADQLVLMIDQKFGGEMGELRKEFEISIHEKEKLKEIIKCEEHLANFLK